jgi:CTP:molybdopterin cytidylyltransferase MocA
VLSRQLHEQIKELIGDTGMSSVLRNHPGVLEWPVGDRIILEDIDTPNALKDMLGA